MASLKYTDDNGKETTLDMTNKVSDKDFERFIIDNLGEHLETQFPYSEDILKELGYSDERIKELTS